MSSQEKKNEIATSKYNLYLDREKLKFIQIDLDNNTTCDKILMQYKDSLTDTINSIYSKILMNVCF